MNIFYHTLYYCFYNYTFFRLTFKKCFTVKSKKGGQKVRGKYIPQPWYYSVPPSILSSKKEGGIEAIPRFNQLWWLHKFKYKSLKNYKYKYSKDTTRDEKNNYPEETWTNTRGPVDLIRAISNSNSAIPTTFNLEAVQLLEQERASVVKSAFDKATQEKEKYQQDNENQKNEKSSEPKRKKLKPQKKTTSGTSTSTSSSTSSTSTFISSSVPSFSSTPIAATSPRKKYVKRKRCGVCEGCLNIDDCNKCKTCLDKKKNGGPGTMKQICMLRKCEVIISAKKSSKRKTPRSPSAAITKGIRNQLSNDRNIINSNQNYTTSPKKASPSLSIQVVLVENENHASLAEQGILWFFAPSVKSLKRANVLRTRSERCFQMVEHLLRTTNNTTDEMKLQILCDIQRIRAITLVSIQSERERASRNGSTVVDIFIPPPYFKPVLLSLSRFPLF